MQLSNALSIVNLFNYLHVDRTRNTSVRNKLFKLIKKNERDPPQLENGLFLDPQMRTTVEA
jgi:hypothetical protein